MSEDVVNEFDVLIYILIGWYIYQQKNIILPNTEESLLKYITMGIISTEF